MTRAKAPAALVLVLVIVSLRVAHGQQPAPQISGLQKSQAKQMLQAIQLSIREKYYDPKFHGIDLNAHFRDAAAKIDQARNMVQPTASSRRR